MVEDFVNNSNTFNGFVFNGNYNMPNNHFFKLYNIYKETGNNLLDTYSDVIYMIWENDMCIFSLDEYNYKRDLISKIRRLNLLDYDDIHTAIYNLDNARYKLNERINKANNKPRRTASIYISKLSVRNEVFNLYGKKCLCCGSDKNITIDHVVPVYKGGKNEISNLQPLCKSCNSSKGIKIIDYRI